MANHKKKIEKHSSASRQRKLHKLRVKIEAGKYRIGTEELARALIMAH